jgi:hypothetical protein
LERQELRNKESADQAHIAELVRKYQELENYLKKIITQSKKRSVLEEKIINLGLDHNLLKNQAELFSSEK